MAELLVLEAVVGAVGLAIIHLAVPHLDALDERPNWWLSVAGGGAVAYVFLEALASFPAVTASLHATTSVLGYLAHHVHVVALAGFGAYYLLEHVVSAYVGDEGSDVGIFTAHLASYVLYNGLVGYLLVHPEVLGHGVALFAVAMALHVLGTDFDLVTTHGDRYDRYGRWILVVAIGVGLVIGHLVPVDHAVPGVAYAFLAGGVILNVVKEELPEAGEARIPGFLLGVVVYGGVVLAWEVVVH